MDKVRVLPVPASAYDPSRPPSSLLKSQIRQLQVAVFDAVDSEAEAALCVRTLNRLLQQLRPHLVPRSHREATKSAKKRVATKRTKVTRGRTSTKGTKKKAAAKKKTGTRTR